MHAGACHYTASSAHAYHSTVNDPSTMYVSPVTAWLTSVRGRLQLTYDLYKPYFNKNATSKELLLVSRISVAFFGLIMAIVSVIFYKVRGAIGLLSVGPLWSCS